ncbi:hypothetical protein C8R45DRAFT_302501 [Mycena sanguinolenta]|nr:hypothetical protein C8R45DRAFT_302501 [Mycena sanguinolenta]
MTGMFRITLATSVLVLAWRLSSPSVPSFAISLACTTVPVLLSTGPNVKLLRGPIVLPVVSGTGSCRQIRASCGFSFRSCWFPYIRRPDSRPPLQFAAVDLVDPGCGRPHYKLSGVVCVRPSSGFPSFECSVRAPAFEAPAEVALATRFLVPSMRRLRAGHTGPRLTPSLPRHGSGRTDTHIVTLIARYYCA